MKRVRFILWIFLLLTFASPYSFAIGTKVEDALVKGDWEKVIDILKQDDSKANDPVARLIMGHACLATNKNNESMLLFLSVKEENDLDLWAKWTETLLSKYPQNPVAIYLSSDAKARQGKLKEAIEGFTQAISIKEDFSLAYNARGVVRVLNNEWNNAGIDFLLATRIDPKLADAYANLGTYYIVIEAAEVSNKQEEPDEVIDAFKRALDINPEFALAYNGMGCAYFGKGDFESAAKWFSIASQKCPVLVVAEINQGFAFAYASKLITVAEELEKKPGTTLKSINEQYPNLLKEQNQQLLNMLPSQKDQEFWRKMDALPWILESNEKTEALIKEYGLEKIQMGAFLKIQEWQRGIAEATQKMQTLDDKRSYYNQKIWNLRQSELWSSLGCAALGTGMELAAVKTGKMTVWDALVRSELKVAKAVISSLSQDRRQELLASALPTTIDPLIYAINVVPHFCLKTARYMAEDKLYTIDIEHKNLFDQAILQSAWIQATRENLPKIGGFYKIGETAIAQPPIKPLPSQIPGYYTSNDRPLTELYAISSMVDKTIKPIDGSTRRALVVAQDPFRANLLQQELHKYGFETRIISPTMDVQSEAKKWGADVIVGIKGSKTPPPLKIQEIKQNTYYDDLRKYLPPPDNDNGGGGGAAGIPQWDWGKPFTHTYPKGAPGGVSTEEIAKSFVDKGNWPVLTSFSLFYNAGYFAKKENVKKDK
jgi:tetratricopeptide (TPR) repeat protein